MARYLSPVKRGIVGFLRPKSNNHHHAKVLRLAKEMAAQPGDALTFEDKTQDRVAAYFHTGGTTGTPKVAQHFVSTADVSRDGGPC